MSYNYSDSLVNFRYEIDNVKYYSKIFHKASTNLCNKFKIVLPYYAHLLCKPHENF